MLASVLEAVVEISMSESDSEGSESMTKTGSCGVIPKPPRLDPVAKTVPLGLTRGGGDSETGRGLSTAWFRAKWKGRGEAEIETEPPKRRGSELDPEGKAEVARGAPGRNGSVWCVNV